MKNPIAFLYHVDPENGVVRCILIDRENGDCAFGVAKCHEDDSFDVNVGMELSKVRAKIAYAKTLSNRYMRKIHKLNKMAEKADKLADERRLVLSDIGTLTEKEEEILSRVSK